MNYLTFRREGRRLCLLAVVVAGALLGLLPGASGASSEAAKKSGYGIGTETCGSGALAFPRLKIDMKAGFCAGLVASEEDRLRFPRAIVQLPGRNLFVVADMGGWSAPMDGCCCSIRTRPRASASRSY